MMTAYGAELWNRGLDVDLRALHPMDRTGASRLKANRGPTFWTFGQRWEEHHPPCRSHGSRLLAWARMQAWIVDTRHWFSVLPQWLIPVVSAELFLRHHARRIPITLGLLKAEAVWRRSSGEPLASIASRFPAAVIPYLRASNQIERSRV